MQRRKNRGMSEAEFKKYITYPRKEDFIGLLDKFIEQVILMPGDSYATIQNFKLILPVYTLEQGKLHSCAAGRATTSNKKDDHKDESNALLGEIVIWQQVGNQYVEMVIVPFEFKIFVMMSVNENGQPTSGISPCYSITMGDMKISEEETRRRARFDKIVKELPKFDEYLEMYASTEQEPLPELKHISKVEYKSLTVVKPTPMPKDSDYKKVQLPAGLFKKDDDKSPRQIENSSESKNQVTSSKQIHTYPRKDDFFEWIESFIVEVIKMPQDSHATIRNLEFNGSVPNKGEICMWQTNKSSIEPLFCVSFLIKLTDLSYKIVFDTSIPGVSKEPLENKTARREHMMVQKKAFKKTLEITTSSDAKPLPKLTFIKDIQHKSLENAAQERHHSSMMSRP